MPFVLHFADLADELVREHVDELVQLVFDAQEHVANVVLPVGDRVRVELVLAVGAICLLLNRVEALEAPLVALKAPIVVHPIRLRLASFSIFPICFVRLGIKTSAFRNPMSSSVGSFWSGQHNLTSM